VLQREASSFIAISLLTALSLPSWLVSMFDKITALQIGSVAIERIKYVIDLPKEEDHQPAISMPVFNKGEVSFTNVDLRYKSGLSLALNGITLRVPAGSRVGIVGRVRLF